MHTKFKRHQKVRLLIDPSTEYTDYFEDTAPVPIKKGMVGKINIILPNGQYHVEILDKNGQPIAYVPMNEEYLEEVKEN